jgi:Tyrosine-protein kinase ephrin type A/B receptor-like
LSDPHCILSVETGTYKVSRRIELNAMFKRPVHIVTSDSDAVHLQVQPKLSSNDPHSNQYAVAFQRQKYASGALTWSGGRLEIDLHACPGVRGVLVSAPTALLQSDDDDSSSFVTTMQLPSLAVFHATLGHDIAVDEADGAGVLIVDKSIVELPELEIEHCTTINGNGGGVAVSGGSSVTISRSVFSHCSAGGEIGGGAVFVSGQSSHINARRVDIQHTLTANENACGGGIALHSTGALTNDLDDNNDATAVAAVAESDGSVVQTILNLHMNNVTAASNKGHAICVSVSLMHLESCRSPIAHWNAEQGVSHSSMLYSSDLAQANVATDTCVTGSQYHDILRAISDCRVGVITGSQISSPHSTLACSVCAPGQASHSVNSSCSDCPLGTYASGFGATMCSSCIAGSTTLGTGSVQCFDCPAGLYHNDTSNACEPCPAATFTNTTGQTQCKLCPPGSSTQSDGAVQCVECPAGLFQNSTTKECNACPIGTFTNATGQTQCVDCPPGSSTQSEGAVQCIECPAGLFQNSTTKECNACPIGTFTNATGQTQCVPCPAGSTTQSEGAVQCVTCAPGQYQNRTTLECKSCDPGTFSASSGMTRCERCSAGAFAPAAGSVVCSICAAGRYSSLNGSTKCIPCDSGHIAPSDGSTKCTACSPGRFSEFAGSVGCTDCPSGMWSAATGASMCQPCGIHTFSPRPGATECLKCGNSSSSVALSFANRTGAQFCDTCGSLHYLRYPNRTDPATFHGCELCAANADCSSGVPVAHPNYWISIDAASGTASAFECSNPLACQDDGSCGINRKDAAFNPLCASCIDGHQEWGGECIKCDSTNVTLVVMLLIFVLLAVAWLHRASQSSSAYMGTLTYFLQITLLMVGSQTGSSSASDTLLSSANLDALSMSGSSCVAQMSEHARVLSGLIGPAVAYGMWLILFCVALLWNHMLKDSAMVRALAGYCDSGVEALKATICCCQVSKSESSHAGEQSGASPSSSVSDSSSKDSIAASRSTAGPRLGPRLASSMRSTWSRSTSRLTEQLQQGTKGADALTHWTKNLYTVYNWPAHDGARMPDASEINVARQVKALLTPIHTWCRALIALYFFTFNGVTQTVFSTFSCKSVVFQGSTISVIDAFPTVECTGAQYTLLVTVSAIVAILYVIAVPMLLIYGMYTLSQRHQKEGLPKVVVRRRGNRPNRQVNGADDEHVIQTPPSVLEHACGVMYDPYRRDGSISEVWKVFVLLRRLVLVLALVFIPDRGWRLATASIMNVAFLMLHMMTHPYRAWLDNAVETFSLSMLTLISLVLQQLSPPYSQQDNRALFCMWIIPFSVLAIWVIGGKILRFHCSKDRLHIAFGHAKYRKPSSPSCAQSKLPNHPASALHSHSQSELERTAVQYSLSEQQNEERYQSESQIHYDSKQALNGGPGRPGAMDHHRSGRKRGNRNHPKNSRRRDLGSAQQAAAAPVLPPRPSSSAHSIELTARVSEATAVHNHDNNSAHAKASQKKRKHRRARRHRPQQMFDHSDSDI